jgi:hypothetical protein
VCPRFRYRLRPVAEIEHGRRSRGRVGLPYRVVKRKPRCRVPGLEPPGVSVRGVGRVSTGPRNGHTEREGRVISARVLTALEKAPGPEEAGTDRETFRVPASRVRLMLTPRAASPDAEWFIPTGASAERGPQPKGALAPRVMGRLAQRFSDERDQRRFEPDCATSALEHLVPVVCGVLTTSP